MQQVYCPEVWGNYMYKCSALANMVKAVHEGAIGSEWNRVLTHKPVTVESSPQEILDYLRRNVALPECSVCPETHEIILSRQLSTEQVKQIKMSIQQRVRKTA